MEIKQIEAFVWVVWERSYTRAADALGITQPAVSARVSSLEKELGYALFRHGLRQVEVTTAGEHFLKYGEEILRLAAEATSDTASIGPSDRVPALRIGSNTAMAAGPLPRWIREFGASTGPTRPQFEVIVDRTPSLVPMLRIGKLELAFVSPLMAPPASKTVLHFAAPLTLAVASGHELAGAQVGLRELAGRAAIGFVSGPGGLQLKRIQRALPTPMCVIVRSNSAFVVRMMAESGVGLAILPVSAITDAVCEGRLATVELTDYDLGAWDVAAVRWRDRTIRAEVEEFIDFVSATVEGGPAFGGWT